MNRFDKTQHLSFRFLLPFLVFGAVIALFLAGLSSVSRTASVQEAENLRSAILRSAVQCYALEGWYPEDLSYLEEHYHITYDPEKYVVAYEAVGANLMPDVTVIPLNGQETVPGKEDRK